MKKVLVCLLALVMLVTLCACTGVDKAKAKKAIRETFTAELAQSQEVNTNSISLKIGSISQNDDQTYDVYGMIYADNRTGGSTYSYEFHAQVKDNTVTKLESDILTRFAAK